MLLCHSRELLQDHLGVWRAQAGYLGWVQARYWSNSGAGWQDPNNPQQGIYQCMFITSNKQEKELIIYTGRHDDPPTADEGLRGPSLVLVKDPRQSWGRGISCTFCTHLQSTSTHYNEVEKILSDCMLQVSRVYVGSFWSQPLRYVANRELFEAEQVLKWYSSKLKLPSFVFKGDLFSDLQGLPRFSTMRKMNDLIKRARSAKVCKCN